MKKKWLLAGLLLVMSLIFLTGCMPGDGTYTASHPAGFFWGIWHGWIAPVSLIISIFSRNIRIYESMNTGIWYDFGYYIAVISGFGGLSVFRRRGRYKKDAE